MIAQADAVRIPLADKSVHCCMTSPPYWGLRKYAGNQGDEPLGLEPTPERHIERMVEVFREVRRVLRDDGVLFLNYGDSYSGVGGDNFNSGLGNSIPAAREWITNSTRRAKIAGGNLTMMPHRVALALQQDGWIVRQDLVWFKRNPMPESVNGWRWQRERTKTKAGSVPRMGDPSSSGQRHFTAEHSAENWKGLAEWEYGDDLELRKGSWRHTRAHEYVFMLVKGMQYWSNQEAVRESNTQYNTNRPGRGGNIKPPDELSKPDFFNDPDKPFVKMGRNPRSVLDVPTAPYKGAHYATFPPNLIAPLIRATCPRWACPVCGQGWAAIVERSANYPSGSWHGHKHDLDQGARNFGEDGGGPVSLDETQGQSVLGYRPTCEHEHTQEEAVPGIVFDPFVGSGTTVAVAKSLLRRGIGIDISMEYLDQQAKVRAGLGTPSNALDNLPLFQ